MSNAFSVCVIAERGNIQHVSDLISRCNGEKSAFIENIFVFPTTSSRGVWRKYGALGALFIAEGWISDIALKLRKRTFDDHTKNIVKYLSLKEMRRHENKCNGLRCDLVVNLSSLSDEEVSRVIKFNYIAKFHNYGEYFSTTSITDYISSALGRSSTPIYVEISSAGGEAVAKFCGHIATAFLGSINQIRLNRRRVAHALRLAALLCEGCIGEVSAPIEMVLEYPRDRANYIFTAVAYFLRSVLSLCAKVGRRMSIIGPNIWSVAYVRSTFPEVTIQNPQFIPNRMGHFIADPFVVQDNSGLILLAEDFDIKRKMASICAYRLSANFEYIGTVLEEPFHLSFPYIFSYDNKFFMVPETLGAGQIRIYESDAFPFSWRLVHIAFDKISAADSIIFCQGERWWLFTNIDPTGGGECCSELYAFYSDSPFGEWIPHAKNPIVADPLRARNGGVVFKDGHVYRISQRKDFDSYGSAATINRIDILSSSEYGEVPLYSFDGSEIEPADGLHHLSCVDNFVFFDWVVR